MLNNYPGSKGGSGVAKRLVSLMPPHRIYVEGFLGAGAVMLLKKPARLNFGFDASRRVVAAWESAYYVETYEDMIGGYETAHQLLPDDALGNAGAMLCVKRLDMLDYLADPPRMLQHPDTLLYLDPPYLRTVRTRLFYECEMASPEEHAVLLEAIKTLRCMVMISHYPCRQYDDTLADWRRVTYRCMTRGGPRIEACYLNFPPPATFHDPRFLGDGYRERERMKRKATRWHRRFTGMSPAERAVVATALAGVDQAVMRQALNGDRTPSEMTGGSGATG